MLDSLIDEDAVALAIPVKIELLGAPSLPSGGRVWSLDDAFQRMAKLGWLKLFKAPREH